jgi:hypothetical protein
MSRRLARIALAVCLAAIYSTLGVVRPITNYLRDSGLIRVSVATAFAGAASLMLWLILRDPRNRSIRTVIALVITGAVYALVILPMDSPEEKIHFIEYGVVALLASAATPPDLSGSKRFMAAALFVVAAGWIDEGIQALLPSRVYDLRDVAFNAVAGLLALTSLAVCFPRGRTMGIDRPEDLA